MGAPLKKRPLIILIGGTVLIYLIPFLVVFGALELLSRLSGYKPHPSKSGLGPTVVGYFWISDPRLGFKNRPNGSYYNEKIRCRPLVTTDKFGFRNGFGWSPEGDSPIVLFVGDSTTFCAEVEDSHTSPSEVARLLRQQREVRVLNGGVRGYSSLQSKRMLEECLELFPQIKIVVYTFCTNDYSDNLVPDKYYPAKAPVLKFDRESNQWRIVEVTEPACPWGESFACTRESLKDKIVDFLLSHSVVAVRARNAFKKISDLMGFSSLDAYEWAQRNHGDHALEELLRRMQHICLQKGVIFLTTIFYYGADADPLPELISKFPDIATRAGVPFVDLKGCFRDDPRAYMAPARDFQYDPHFGHDSQYDRHFGHKGTRTFAEALVPTLNALLSSQHIR